MFRRISLDGIENTHIAPCIVPLDGTITNIKSSIYINMVLMPKTNDFAHGEKCGGILSNAYRIYTKTGSKNNLFCGAKGTGCRHMSG